MNYKQKVAYVFGDCMCMTIVGIVYASLTALNNPIILMTGMWGVFAGFFLNEYINVDNDDDGRY